MIEGDPMWTFASMVLGILEEQMRNDQEHRRVTGELVQQVQQLQELVMSRSTSSPHGPSSGKHAHQYVILCPWPHHAP
jgi:hypothetical protein